MATKKPNFQVLLLIQFQHLNLSWDHHFLSPHITLLKWQLNSTLSQSPISCTVLDHVFTLLALSRQQRTRGGRRWGWTMQKGDPESSLQETAAQELPKPEAMSLYLIALTLLSINFPVAFVIQNFFLLSLVMPFWRFSALVGHLTKPNSSVSPTDLKVSLFTFLLKSLTTINAFTVQIYKVLCLLFP